ncbi:MAG: hypothetical protein JRL30_29610, partial [Deltaproteobacteria bacterium]|nr:hypothetical protein [Deltaproteobacteria bacterium]
MRTQTLIEVQKDSTYTFQYFKEVNNALSTISAATITIYDPSNNEILAATAMSVSGDIATHAWDSTGKDMGRNYYVKFIPDGGTPIVRFFDIYAYPFINDITDDDLIAENEVLKKGSFN